MIPMNDPALPAGPARVALAVMADENTLLLFGDADRALPDDAPALMEEARVEARFQAHCWTRCERTHHFVAVVSARDLARHRPGRLVVELGEEGALALPRVSNVRMEPSALPDALRAQGPECLHDVFGFLVRALSGADGETTPRVGRFLYEFLKDIAEPDGFGEIFGRLDDSGGLMLQGWGSHIGPGQHQLLFALPSEAGGERLTAAQALVGKFNRGDLPPTAHGVVAVLPDVDMGPDSIRRVYFKGPQRWRYLETFEGRTVLPDGVATAHLRDMLPQIQGGPQTLKALTKLAHARFEGHETVSRLNAPFRIALDTAVRVPGSGLFLQGWMLDPEQRVAAITLRGPQTAVRLDTAWARTPRADVGEAFAGDPAFAGRLVPGQDDHGFQAWVPAATTATGRWYLTVELDDEQVGFLPAPAGLPSPDLTQRLLNGIDLADPRTPDLVARHIGPMVSAAGARAAGSATPAVVEMGTPHPKPAVSVILAVASWREDLDLHIARLALDPDFADAEIIVAAGPQAPATLAARLRQASQFYRLPVRLVPVPWARHGVEAMAAALAHARAPATLLLSAGVMPLVRGWLSAMRETLDDLGNRGVVSPTLLYEDFSVRYAGYRREDGAEDRPGGLVPAYAGYPPSWLPDGPAEEVAAASADCALLPTELARRAAAHAGAFIGAEAAGLDLGFRARALGARCVWLPHVRLVAVEEGARGEVPYWQQTGQLVDRWMFDTTWAATAA